MKTLWNGGAIPDNLKYFSNLADCIKQMIRSGDFTKYVRVDTRAQTISYEPFSRCMDLEAKLDAAMRKIHAIEHIIDDNENEENGQ